MTSSAPASLAGRTFLVTGASSGIGRTTALALVARGAAVVIANRSEQKSRPVLDELRRVRAGADVDFVPLDLADLASVRRAAATFLASGRGLDVLVNNAGIAGTPGLTRDGFEITLGTNHLGPFLLTELLLPRLREAPQGRIVNVSSNAQLRPRRIDWAWLRRPTRTSPERMHMYQVSKLMNVMHAAELARRLAGTRVTTYALHPGVVATDIWRELSRPVAAALKLFMISEEKGARTTLHCATAPELAARSGRYYDRCRESRVNRLADDAALARELFERSEHAIAAAG